MKKIIVYMGTEGLNKQFAKNHLGTKGKGESPRLKSREEGREMSSGQQGNARWKRETRGTKGL